MLLRKSPEKAYATAKVPPRPKKCKACGEKFQPARSMQAVCGPVCAQVIVNRKRAAEEKKDTAARKEKLKTRRDWEREAQAAFNAWIRARDAHKPCISCGRHHTGQWHAGHYLSTGARPELRFNPDNTQKQCQPCNVHLSGNLVMYRVGLIARIGVERVEALEGPAQPLKLTIDEMREMKKKYRAEARRLEATNAQDRSA